MTGSKPDMRFWANLIGYQLVRFAIVISALRKSPMVQSLQAERAS